MLLTTVPVAYPDGRLKLPPEMIDAQWLHELLGYAAGTPDVLGPEAYERVRGFERAVDDARVAGRLKRLAVRDRDSQGLLGYCYRRDDVLGLFQRRK
ncbi:MAG: hypothetical protein ACRDF8_03965 [Chloroflexota bacterium]